MRVATILLLIAASCGGPDRHLQMQLQSQSDRLHDDCARGATVDDCPGHRAHLVCMLGRVEALPHESDDEIRFFQTQCRDSRYSVNEFNRTCGDPPMEMSPLLDDRCGQYGG